MGVSVTGEQLRKNTNSVRAQARRQPVQVTYHGHAELVVLSIEHYQLLRRKRKAVYRIESMPLEKIERIARNKMDKRHARARITARSM